MSVSLPVLFPPPAEPEVEQGGPRAHANPPSIPGSGSSGESGGLQSRGLVSGPEQDVVKVQLEPPGEIPVYQFVNQQGSLVLQVPPQQLLNLALEISQELAENTAPKTSAGSAGGKPNGH